MLTDRFIKLLTKELSDELTPAEQDELQLLLQDNKEYRDQRELLKDYWKGDIVEYAANAAMFNKVMHKIKASEDTSRVDQTDPVELNAAVPDKRRSLLTWFTAASIVLLAIGILTYRIIAPDMYGDPVAVKWLKKTTKPAAKLIVTLSDGTVITLNSGTSLKYPDNFSGKTREVYLDGEAYFDVHKDKSHPFIIHTNKLNVRVLGTAFNVKAYKNEPLIETTLIRGAIEVTLNDRPSDRIILKPKEKLIVQSNTSLIKKTTNLTADPTSQHHGVRGIRYSLTNLTYFPNNSKTIIETSWVQNKLVFSDKDFTQIASPLERWYGVHIEFANERVKQYRFSALFEKESLSQALNALQMTEPFHYRINDSTVYIY